MNILDNFSTDHTDKTVEMLKKLVMQIVTQITVDRTMTASTASYKTIIQDTLKQINDLDFAANPECKDFAKGYAIMIISTAEMTKREILLA